MLINATGGDTRAVFAKMVVDSRGALTTASSVADPPFFNLAGGLQNSTKTVLGYNMTFRSTGPHSMLTLCPLEGTTVATANSRLDFFMQNIVAEWTGAASNFRMNVSDCGRQDSFLTPYGDAAAWARASVKFSGVWDVDDDNPGCSGPCFFEGLTSTSRAVGACGTANSFLNTVCTTTDNSGNRSLPGAWEWFSTTSGDSGGLGVDGLQWATTDPQLRCASSAKECFGLNDVSVPAYTLSLRDYWYETDVSCIPEDVVGAPICAFKLAAVHAGAR
jgi:hypothetical protein